MPPPRKRTKTTHPTAGQSQGGRGTATIPLPRLKTLRAARECQRKALKLNTLPLDVLGEISSHLHPQDLLKLALTSKDIARFLLNPHQEYIWRNARLRTPGLPELPPFMGERAFARFLFSRCCALCGQDDVKTVRWTWFARYCSDCLPKARYNGKEAYDKYYASCEYLRDNEDLNELVNVINPSRNYDTFTKKGNYVLRQQLDDFLKEWHAAETDEARRELLKRQKALVKRRERHAELLQHWDQTVGAAERRQANRLAKLKCSVSCWSNSAEAAPAE